MTRETLSTQAGPGPGARGEGAPNSLNSAAGVNNGKSAQAKLWKQIHRLQETGVVKPNIRRTILVLC
jgi:hypothetical protein